MAFNLLFLPVYIYAGLCLVFAFVWIKNRKKSQSNLNNRLSFSILIPARNEEVNIERLLNSIVSQNYPKANLEIILIDDLSTDSTKKIAEHCLSSAGVAYQIITNDKLEKGSPKKRAITKAIGLAQNEYILCTDADCQVGPNWIQSFNEIYQKTDSKFISGPVTFFEQKEGAFFRKMWNRFQIVEFASLIGTGAASIYLRNPNMCSGANISYSKKVFSEVGGYAGNEEIASGDDEFLMHKINQKFPNSITYNQCEDAIVLTNDQENLKSFFAQRKRWASKWTFYKNLTPKLVAIFIFAINAFTIWAIFSLDIQILAIRWICEFAFLAIALAFLKKRNSIGYIVPLQFIYPFYVVFFGLLSLQKTSYNWKGRNLR